MSNFKFLTLGLSSSTIISIVIAPLAAYGQIFQVPDLRDLIDAAQNAEQSATIRGDNNTVDQSINQTIILRPNFSLFPRATDNKEKRSKVRRRRKKMRKYDKNRRSQGWRRDWDDDDDRDDDDD